MLSSLIKNLKILTFPFVLANRSQFWVGQLIITLIHLFAVLYNYPFILLLIPMYFAVCLIINRLHDLGYSGFALIMYSAINIILNIPIVAWNVANELLECPIWILIPIGLLYATTVLLLLLFNLYIIYKLCFVAGNNSCANRFNYLVEVVEPTSGNILNGEVETIIS